MPRFSSPQASVQVPNRKKRNLPPHPDADFDDDHNLLSPHEKHLNRLQHWVDSQPGMRNPESHDPLYEVMNPDGAAPGHHERNKMEEWGYHSWRPSEEAPPPPILCPSVLQIFFLILCDICLENC